MTRLDVPDPSAIYTVGLNYRAPGEAPGSRPDRPLIYGKAATSIAGDGARLDWDRSLTANVDAEVELGVVMGETAWNVSSEEALGFVLGYTIVNDVSSRDPWLDGDQWLLGKSMPGFCPFCSHCRQAYLNWTCSMRSKWPGMYSICQLDSSPIFWRISPQQAHGF